MPQENDFPEITANQMTRLDRIALLLADLLTNKWNPNRRNFQTGLV
jgi:hypothetical protein